MMGKKLFVGLAILALFFSTAFAVITVPPIEWGGQTVDQPDNVPKITKITYNEQVVFENGKIKEVRMDPSSGTLSVSYVPIKDATYYSVEIWALTEAEAKEFNSWGVDKKNSIRQFQFILKQDATDVVASLHNIQGLKFANLVDQSKTKWYPDRNKERCIAKYSWIAAAYDGKSCESQATVEETWKKFTFQKYYEYVKKYNNGKRFYLVVENSTNPNDSSKWVDSVPIPLIIGDVPPQVQTGKCKTIVECKALVDKAFVKVFK